VSFVLFRARNLRNWVTGACLPLALAACHRHSEESAPLPVAARAGESSAAANAEGAPSANASVNARAKANAAKTNADRRDACVFRAGASPRDTIDQSDPIGSKIPIDHFVVVLQENRSFDQYFQALPEAGQPDVDVAPPSYDNPDPSGEGEIVHPYLLSDPCIPDVPHNWIAVHHQLADGKMTGFVAAANPDGKRALGYYDQSTLGYYYALANTFAIGDRYFASVPGPTFPNRMFFLSATSFGHAKNTPPPPRDEESTLFHQLEEKGLSWIVYSEGSTFEEDMYPRLHSEKGEHFRPMSEFYTDAQAGRLPFFAWVESTYEGELPTDEHAPANVQIGQAFVARVIGNVMNSTTWPRTALFVTYDEHGGFYDHVKPPHACPPDEAPPNLKGISSAVRFDQFGARVPFIVVSPFARAHFVSHRVHSHTSVLRMVQARAELPALTDRDANAEPPFELFDFEHPPFLVPPTLPQAVIDPVQKKRCIDVAREAQAKKKKDDAAHPSTG
jgi:phospholipase C